MPGFTCPEIDNVKELIEGRVIKIEDCLAELHDSFSLLEDLRSSNDALRQWCEYWETVAHDWEAELESANNRIAGLEARIEELTE